MILVSLLSLVLFFSLIESQTPTFESSLVQFDYFVWQGQSSCGDNGANANIYAGPSYQNSIADLTGHFDARETGFSIQLGYIAATAYADLSQWNINVYDQDSNVLYTLTAATYTGVNSSATCACATSSAAPGGQICARVSFPVYNITAYIGTNSCGGTAYTQLGNYFGVCYSGENVVSGLGDFTISIFSNQLCYESYGYYDTSCYGPCYGGHVNFECATNTSCGNPTNNLCLGYAENLGFSTCVCEAGSKNCLQLSLPNFASQLRLASILQQGLVALFLLRLLF